MIPLTEFLDELDMDDRESFIAWLGERANEPRQYMEWLRLYMEWLVHIRVEAIQLISTKGP